MSAWHTMAKFNRLGHSLHQIWARFSSPTTAHAWITTCPSMELRQRARKLLTSEPVTTTCSILRRCCRWIFTHHKSVATLARVKK